MQVGVVVIGRNEGERLQRCLHSVAQTAAVVVYVDSGSSDGSVAFARSQGVEVVELDMSLPFSAARARNAGVERLLQLDTPPGFVQFLDGDCTLAPDWLKVAVAELTQRQECAAVVGHLRELHPEASSYNRLCALEWKSPPGDMSNFGALGGISMMRVAVFQALDGFNQQVIAGEDSELGVRMALAGYKVAKLDQPMANHDANILRFSQWWRRAVRSGHAIGQRAFLNGDSIIQDCVRERRSVCFWGIALPLWILLMTLPTNGASLLLLGGYLFLGWRVYRYRRLLGDVPADALLYAKYILLGKFAEAAGLFKFYLNRLRARYEIIEYK